MICISRIAVRVRNRSMEVFVETKLSFKTAVCTEYECLLLLSKAAFDDFRMKHAELLPSERNKPEGELALRRLREDYEFQAGQAFRYLRTLPVHVRAR
jgi:hypothetical protein